TRARGSGAAAPADSARPRPDGGGGAAGARPGTRRRTTTPASPAASSARAGACIRRPPRAGGPPPAGHRWRLARGDTVAPRLPRPRREPGWKGGGSARVGCLAPSPPWEAATRPPPPGAAPRPRRGRGPAPATTPRPAPQRATLGG